jgi:hypothetical protein
MANMSSSPILDDDGEWRVEFKARYLARVNGRRAYRFPVRIVTHDSSRRDPEYPVRDRLVYVTAFTAADAANWVRDHEPGAAEPETTVTAYGPRGGRTERFTGWFSFIGHAINQPRHGRTLPLPLEVPRNGN